MLQLCDNWIVHRDDRGSSNVPRSTIQCSEVDALTNNGLAASDWSASLDFKADLLDLPALEFDITDTELDINETEDCEHGVAGVGDTNAGAFAVCFDLGVQSARIVHNAETHPEFFAKDFDVPAFLPDDVRSKDLLSGVV
ncbi:MAG: hypothetical protein R3C18_16045 [Planctomycetaceae bacterium]